MVEELAITLIKDLGVPVAAFMMMFWLYVQNQKWQQKQQEKSEQRYVDLVTNFVNTTREITEKHTKALEGLATKIDEHMRQKDQFIELIKEERRQGT